MNFDFFCSVYRPRWAAAGLVLLVPALAALFFWHTSRIEVRGSHILERKGMLLHGITADVPLNKKTVKAGCPLKIDTGLWSVMLISSPENGNELLVTGGGRTVLRRKCQGIDQGGFDAVRLSLHDGMILLEDSQGRSAFPARNFSLKEKIRIQGFCVVETAGAYKFSRAAGTLLLALAVVCGLAGLAPPFRKAPGGSRRLRITGLLCAAGMMTALLICLYHVLTGANHYPYNTFLFRPGTVGDDLFQTLLSVRYTFLPYGWVEAGNYFPFTYLFLYLLPLYDFYAAAAVLYGAFAFITGIAALKTVRVQNFFEAGILLFLTWGTLPALLLWSSGNLEMLIAILLILFFCCFRRRPGVAALLLAAAINIKLYPGLAGALFLKEKRYKQAFLCFFFSLALLLAALAALKWDISGAVACFKHFTGRYTVFINDGLIFSHSLFSLYRYIGSHFCGLTGEGIRAVLPFYTVFSLLLGGFIVWRVLTEKFSRWETLFLLTAPAVLLPPVSFDHTLILLLPAFWLFLRESREEKYTFVHILCWVLILIPENWYSSPLWAELQISVLLKPAALVVMLGMILCQKRCSRQRPAEKV